MSYSLKLGSKSSVKFALNHMNGTVIVPLEKNRLLSLMAFIVIVTATLKVATCRMILRLGGAKELCRGLPSVTHS